MENPFLTNLYLGPEYFCDRRSETADLIRHVTNRAHAAFFAQRRIGKTALIQHVLHELTGKKIVCLYADIYSTQSLRDMGNQLATAIYRRFPRESSIGQKFWKAITLLRPTLTIDEMDGMPNLTLELSRKQQSESALPQLLQFLDNQQRPCVLAIDEFQQILSYPERNVEALFRTALGSLRNVRFIFCGSNRSMMNEIFNSAKRPFYRSTVGLKLGKISVEEYSAFISRTFGRYGIHILPEAVSLILELTCRHTYYTQELCRSVFAEAKKQVTPEDVLSAMGRMFLHLEDGYFQIRELITAGQWELLKAIAKEEIVRKPFSADFLYNYRLGSAANVRRGLESLSKKDLIYKNIGDEDPGYEVQDKFMMRWMQRPGR